MFAAVLSAPKGSPIGCVLIAKPNVFMLAVFVSLSANSTKVLRFSSAE